MDFSAIVEVIRWKMFVNCCNCWFMVFMGGTAFLSQCSVTCGGGVQARTVQCQIMGKPSTSCVLHLRPSSSQACNTNFCPQPEKKGTEPLFFRFLLKCFKQQSFNNESVFVFVFPQIWLAGITSAGVIWFPNMESATTSSMASSAATLVQIQTYNPSKWLLVVHM